MYNKLLQEHVCEVTFTKKNGEQRTMICTLMPEFLPIYETEEGLSTTASKDGIYTVWDLEADAWRSFKADSIISFDSNDE